MGQLRQWGAVLGLGLALAACGNGGNNNEECGDGVLNANEECDDANNINGDGCQADCALPVCGDGILDQGEACDDGNTQDGDECPANCQLDAENVCPAFVDFDRVCVPLNGDPAGIVEIPGEQACAAGFFSVNDFDARRINDEVIIVKELVENNEKPIVAILLGPDRALIYDTGFVNLNNGDNIEDVILPIVGDRQMTVINTHLHGDHINRNTSLGDNPNVTFLAISTPEVDAHCGVSNFDANQSAVCANNARYSPPGDQTLFNDRDFVVDVVVRDGHLIDLGNDIVVEVFATPGHSETSTTLHDRKHRLLFTGDTLYPGDDPPLVHPSTGSNFDEYLATAGRYAALEPVIDFVIGAHDQGTMPRTALGRFLDAVEASEPGDTNVIFEDPANCNSGTFAFINFPAP